MKYIRTVNHLLLDGKEQLQLKRYSKATEVQTANNGHSSKETN